METHPKSKKTKTTFKKILNLFFNIFGKKTKKSFASVISHVIDTFNADGLISFQEKLMLKNITTFGDKKVSRIMTPRSDIIAIKQDATLEEVKKIITDDGHTRIPIFSESFDDVTGFIHSKDVAKFLCEEDGEFTIKKILRKILFVPGSMKLLDVLLKMRTSRVHMAIVLDEFGGVDGLVTIENLIEEIIGDIEDEHDLPSETSFIRIKKIDEKTFQCGGRIEIKKLEEVLKIKIDNDYSFETVGGMALAAFNRVPEIGEEIEKFDLKIKIIDADLRSVKTVEISKI
jgi:CBS domain containing-hemolysin-like protein